MSHKKTNVTQQKRTQNVIMWTPSYAVDILAVSRLINGRVYREKTEIINPWGVRRPPAPSIWRPWSQCDLINGCSSPCRSIALDYIQFVDDIGLHRRHSGRDGLIATSVIDNWAILSQQRTKRLIGYGLQWVSARQRFNSPLRWNWMTWWLISAFWQRGQRSLTNE